MMVDFVLQDVFSSRCGGRLVQEASVDFGIRGLGLGEILASGFRG